MSYTNTSGTGLMTRLKIPYPVVLGAVLGVAYAIAQGAYVLRELVVPSGGAPTSGSAIGGATQTVGPAIHSFGTLAGNFLAGAPVFVLLAVGIAGLVVYHGRSLLEGTLLSLTLTFGVFVGVMSIFEIVGSGKLLFLIGSALLLGVLYGGIGALLGAGIRYVVQ